MTELTPLDAAFHDYIDARDAMPVISVSTYGAFLAGWQARYDSYHVPPNLWCSITNCHTCRYILDAHRDTTQAYLAAMVSDAESQGLYDQDEINLEDIS